MDAPDIIILLADREDRAVREKDMVHLVQVKGRVKSKGQEIGITHISVQQDLRAVFHDCIYLVKPSIYQFFFHITEVYLRRKRS